MVRKFQFIKRIIIPGGGIFKRKFQKELGLGGNFRVGKDLFGLINF